VKLSSQHLAEVLDALRGQKQTVLGMENRRAARIEVHTTVVIVPLQGAHPGRSFTALTRDVSAVGIGMLQATCCELNEQLLVHLPRASKTPLIMLCNVMHVRMLADGLYLIGAEFVSEGPSAEQLAASQSPKKSATTPDAEMQRIRSSILS